MEQGEQMIDDDKLRQEAAAAGEEVTAVCWCAGQTCSGCEANSKALFVKGYLAHAAKAEGLVEALKSIKTHTLHPDNKPSLWNDGLQDLVDEALAAYKGDK